MFLRRLQFRLDSFHGHNLEDAGQQDADQQRYGNTVTSETVHIALATFLHLNCAHYAIAQYYYEYRYMPKEKNKQHMITEISPHFEP